MTNKLRLLLILSLGLFSCTQKQTTHNDRINENLDSVSFELNCDTLFMKSYGKIIQKYILTSEMRTGLNDFPTIIDSFIEKEFSITDSAYIIGDEKKNLYKTWIGITGENVVVRHVIMKNNTTVWNDSLVIDDSFSYYFEDDLFNQLKPYSGLYIGYKYFRTFIDEPLDSSSYRFREGKANILRRLDSRLDSIYWKDYLANFKGRLITNLSDVDHDWLIWDDRREEFVSFYEP